MIGLMIVTASIPGLADRALRSIAGRRLRHGLDLHPSPRLGYALGAAYVGVIAAACFVRSDEGNIDR